MQHRCRPRNPPRNAHGPNRSAHHFRGRFLAQQALQAGAAAYVLKERARTDLADIILAVHQSMKHVTRADALQIADHMQMPTSREMEVLELVAAGNSNKLIARALAISEETAKTHVRNIIAKLGARDRTHAVALAVRRGIIQL